MVRCGIFVMHFGICGMDSYKDIVLPYRDSHDKDDSLVENGLYIETGPWVNMVIYSSTDISTFM